MGRTINICIAIVLQVLVGGCGPRVIDEPKAYFAYLNDPANGLCQEKSVAGIRYKIKYLPADLMAFNEVDGKEVSKSVKDSLLRSYNHSLTFVVNVGPAEGEDFDITRLGVNNYEEFAERIEKMAFGAQDWISLECEGRSIAPAIARMENINAIERSRNFIVVFATETGTAHDLRQSDLSFCYNDELFNTGMNKFVFRANDLSSTPHLKF